MPRPIWSGAISFGLVNVPVKLVQRRVPKDVRFNQLDATRRRAHPAEAGARPTGEEVPYEQIVKGYEIAPDQYVVIEPEELEALDPKATRTIDIEEFVDLDQIDPIYFEQPYYLVPDTGAAKAYALLLEAMKESKKVAHRPARDAHQAVPRRHPAARRRARAGDDALRRRGHRRPTSSRACPRRRRASASAS